MNFSRPSPEELRLENIPGLLAGFLRQLPLVAASSDEGAEARLYPSPSDDPALEELVSDWNAHVQPGLQEHFQSARDMVLADLRQLDKGGKSESLQIPLKHADAWMNVLNQARLVLACENGFSDAELSRRPKKRPGTPRDIARFQMDFYAVLQEVLIECTE